MSLYVAATFSKLMRALGVSSLFSRRLFALLYRTNLVEKFCLIIYLLYAACKCTRKFAQVLLARSLLSNLS